MKTTGQLLRQARRQKKLTIKKLAQTTKIDPRFIKALEKDQYDSLPSATFTKGFIRNLSIALDQDPNSLIAIFRRDNLSPKQKTSKKTSSVSKLRLLLPRYFIIFLGVLIFFLYLGFQYRAVITPPKLELAQPKQNTILVSPIIFEGRTSPDSVISINSSAPISPDQSGYFLKQMNFPPGEYQVKITATNRFNRTRILKVPITVISKD